MVRERKVVRQDRREVVVGEDGEGRGSTLVDGIDIWKES